jgi:hypothetical protein
MQGMNQLVIKINDAVEKGNFTARREGSRGRSGAAGDLVAIKTAWLYQDSDQHVRRRLKAAKRIKPQERIHG